MRKLKFRVWDKINKEFSNHTNRDPFMDLSMGDIFYWERRQNEDGVYEGDIILKDENKNRFVLQQYTGLKDSSGKEIYEGDYLKVPYSWPKYQYDNEGVPIGEPEDMEGFRIYEVFWFSGTIDINGGEYAGISTGFHVKLINCPSHNYDIGIFKNTEYEIKRDSLYNNEPEGLASKYDFCNYGGNGGVSTDYSEVIGNIFQNPELIK